MEKRRRNYQLLIEEGFRTFQQVSDGLPQGSTIQIGLPLTVEFDIVRNVLASANTSSIRIVNLAENTRGKIYKDAFATNYFKGIELKAGYGDTIPTIFKGNISSASSVRESVGMVTRVEAYDGGFAFTNGRADVAFQGGTPINQILDSAIKYLPQVNKGAVGNYSGKLARGLTLSGNPAEQLAQLTNGGFFVDNEKAYCLGDNECIEGELALINADTGLLGTPVREQTVLTFDMIFEPRLLIGQKVRLQSSTEKLFNGDYKVISVRHRGTISDSVCGSAITSVGLWYGTELLKVIK